MPAVCRINDLDVPHCSSMKRAMGSGNVFVNGRAVSCQGDMNSPHLIPSGSRCVIHAAPITTGSTTVKINGKGVGRVGDPLTGCTAVASGSSNVFAGG